MTTRLFTSRRSQPKGVLACGFLTDRLSFSLFSGFLNGLGNITFVSIAVRSVGLAEYSQMMVALGISGFATAQITAPIAYGLNRAISMAIRKNELDVLLRVGSRLILSASVRAAMLAFFIGYIARYLDIEIGARMSMVAILYSLTGSLKDILQRTLYATSRFRAAFFVQAAETMILTALAGLLYIYTSNSTHRLKPEVFLLTLGMSSLAGLIMRSLLIRRKHAAEIADRKECQEQKWMTEVMSIAKTGFWLSGTARVNILYERLMSERLMSASQAGLYFSLVQLLFTPVEIAATSVVPILRNRLDRSVDEDGAKTALSLLSKSVSGRVLGAALMAILGALLYYLYIVFALGISGLNSVTTKLDVLAAAVAGLISGASIICYSILASLRREKEKLSISLLSLLVTVIAFPLLILWLGPTGAFVAMFTASGFRLASCINILTNTCRSAITRGPVNGQA